MPHTEVLYGDTFQTIEWDLREQNKHMQQFIPHPWTRRWWGFDLTSWWGGWKVRGKEWLPNVLASIYPPQWFLYLPLTIDGVISGMLRWQSMSAEEEEEVFWWVEEQGKHMRLTLILRERRTLRLVARGEPVNSRGAGDPACKANRSRSPACWMRCALWADVRNETLS